MKKIKIFLASSAELREEREKFEIEINRKNKMWHNDGVFLHLDIWEDLSAKMSTTRSQDEYNKTIKDSDIFVLLAYTKVGMYTAEEFEEAFGQFKATEKPFIYTYFKNAPINTGEISRKDFNSLEDFKDKIKELGHFYSQYTDFNDLWNQFNKELERLKGHSFVIMKPSNSLNQENYSRNVVNQTHYGSGDIIGGDKIINGGGN